MNDLNQSQGILRKGIVGVVFFVGLAFTAVLTFTLAQQTQAGFDCSGNSWSVGNEAELNTAVACYNSQTTPDDYSIAFTQNISLTASTTAINNTVSGVALIVDGAGFTIDGQKIEGVRPFTINPTTTVSIQNITIVRGNSENLGGGIFNNGNLIIHNSALISNSALVGGGIVNNDSGIVTISTSTFSGNFATNNGGGIYNNSSFTVSNSTVSNNYAELFGGGIFNGSTASMTITDSTISGNEAINGGGIRNTGVGSTTTVRNSIIANSVSGGDCVNHSGVINNDGYNLVEDNSCGFNSGSDPLLGPLQDNGGATFTHALLPGSPAIDAGDTNLTIDQRGVARPQGSADDIGAYEVVHYNTLTIFKNGTGSVSSIPYGIDCGSTCDNDFVSGIVVTLTASSNSNAIFTGWEGAGCLGVDDCALTMESNKVVTATFQSYYPVYLPITIKD